MEHRGSGLVDDNSAITVASCIFRYDAPHTHGYLVHMLMSTVRAVHVAPAHTDLV